MDNWIKEKCEVCDNEVIFEVSSIKLNIKHHLCATHFVEYARELIASLPSQSLSRRNG